MDRLLPGGDTVRPYVAGEGRAYSSPFRRALTRSTTSAYRASAP